jgi:hypothetical protein
MGVAAYEIVPSNGHWGVAHEGRIGGSYATKEAAFEAAAAAASNAIKEGHAVTLHVPGSDGIEPTLGSG